MICADCGNGIGLVSRDTDRRDGDIIREVECTLCGSWGVFVGRQVEGGFAPELYGCLVEGFGPHHRP